MKIAVPSPSTTIGTSLCCLRSDLSLYEFIYPPLRLRHSTDTFKIVNDISSGKNCYLAQDRWQPLMRHDQPSQAVTMANMVFKDEVRIVDDYTQIFAKVPTILRGFYAARHANRSGRRPDANKVMLLMRTAARVRNELVDWYRRYLMLDGPPVEVPATDPRSIYPTVLAYSNPWKGSRHSTFAFHPSITTASGPAVKRFSCRGQVMP